MSDNTQAGQRRHRLAIRALPLLVLAVVAFAAGLWLASGSAEKDAVERFAEAWKEQDFEAMHAELTETAAAENSPEDLRAAYQQAQETATLEGIGYSEPRGPLDQDGESVVALPVQADTRSFGTVEGEIAVPVADGAVDWQPHLVFPGLAPGEELDRQTKAPKRAPILAEDRSPLAEGDAAARTTVGAGGIVTGEVGSPEAERAEAMARQGFPEGAPAGTSGLELAFDEVLAGTPGGKLLAVGEGQRVIASSAPQAGKPLRTTIDPELQDAASAALGDRFGGIAVLDAQNGDVLALAGIAFSAPQPPGSTFKIITVAGALEEGITEPGEEFPVQTSTVVGGREISNAYDESCGGNLLFSFAHSCNTVFAPLGAELGGERLLEEAEQFGFNAPPSLYNEDAMALTKPPSSTIPDPIGSDIDVGVSAIGQGQVLATPLVMASVAQTIANDGVRSPTSLVKDDSLAAKATDTEVVPPQVADQVREMMVEVVSSGTGTSAALPDAVVAGKTGTAELGPKADQVIDPNDPDAEVELEVDAWFAAFAPAKDPKLAIAVMIVNADGDGGAIAAPIARDVLAAGL